MHIATYSGDDRPIPTGRVVAAHTNTHTHTQPTRPRTATTERIAAHPLWEQMYMRVFVWKCAARCAI